MFEHSLKNAYIGEVYEYSYDFRNKSTSQITADGWTVVSGSASFNSNWLYSTSNPFRLKKDWFLTHIANANKVTLTLNYNLAAWNIYWAMAKTLTSSGGTWISGTTTDLAWTQQRSLVVYQDATRVSWMAAWKYTTKCILDFVNKTAIGTITWYADLTRTLTDTEISNIKWNTDLLMIYITSGNSSNYISDISLIVEK